jgi:hypothetical protein
MPLPDADSRSSGVQAIVRDATAIHPREVMKNASSMRLFSMTQLVASCTLMAARSST